jgi:hypothetical protein
MTLAGFSPSRSLIIFVSALLVLVSTSAVPAEAHQTSAACITHDKDAVGGREGSNLRLGNRANIWVNNFTEEQHWTWRMVWIFRTSNFNAEAGWQLDSGVNQGAYPFKTWVNNGVVRSETLWGVWLTKNLFHEFKVHDQNNDHNWSFAYDGSAMGNEFVNMDWGTPIDESERGCVDDSMWAHYKNLNNIGCINCGWQTYSSLSLYIDSPTSNDYDFCRISAIEFKVQQTC